MTKFRAVLRRRWALLAVATLLGLVAGAMSAVFAKAQTDAETVYTASETIVANAGSGANPLIAQDTLKVTRGEVPVKAAAILGVPEQAASLASTVEASFDSESSSISVSSNDVDKAVAQKRTQAFVQAFLEVTNAKLQADSRRQFEQQQADLQTAQQQLAQFDQQYPQFTTPGAVLPNDFATQQLGDQRNQLESSIQDLSKQVKDSELQLSRTAPYESLGPEEPHPASSGLVAVPTSLPVRAALMGVLGLLLGAGVAVVIERVSRRIDTREELVEVVDLPILAEVGYLKEAKRTHDSDGVLKLEGVWSEPYRRVRSAIQFVQATQGRPSGLNGATGDVPADSGQSAHRPKVFLVTSTSPGEGKSTTVALTGEALAETGEPTVVIGGDFRRPEVDRLMGVPRQPSLFEMAQMSLDRPTVDDVVHQSRFPSLYVAPAGKGTREVAGSIEAAKEVAAEAVARGATVVFDSSPLQAANDTIDLLPVVDYVILVVRSGRSTEASLREVVETLQRMDAKILGVVLIGTPAAGRRQTYYYDYYAPSDPKKGGSSQSSGFGDLSTGPPDASTAPPPQPNPWAEEAPAPRPEQVPAGVRTAQPLSQPQPQPQPQSQPGPPAWGPRGVPAPQPPPWSGPSPGRPAPN